MAGGLGSLGGVEFDSPPFGHRRGNLFDRSARPLGGYPGVEQEGIQGVLLHVIDTPPAGLIEEIGAHTGPDHGGGHECVVALVLLGLAAEVVLGEIAIAQPLGWEGLICEDGGRPAVP